MTEGDQAMVNLSNYQIPEAQYPLQIRWADGEYDRHGFPGRNDSLNRKLFVGSIPKFANEKNLQDIFRQFGNVEKIHLMRESDNKSKGCAFVYYELKEHALLAIRDLNGQAYFFNCNKALEVRFAEGKNKKLQYFQNRQVDEHHAPVILSHPVQFSFILLTFQRESIFNINHMKVNITTIIAIHVNVVMTNLIILHQFYLDIQIKLIQSCHNSFNQQSTISKVLKSKDLKEQIYSFSTFLIYEVIKIWNLIFTFQEESDLVQQFQRFGKIISARIMTDKMGKSKGFGFVSFQRPEDAQKAIKQMNGFKCPGSHKRLKVQVKKGHDNIISTPYETGQQDLQNGTNQNIKTNENNGNTNPKFQNNEFNPI